jgi:hypothetical protein
MLGPTGISIGGYEERVSLGDLETSAAAKIEAGTWNELRVGSSDQPLPAWLVRIGSSARAMESGG